MRLTSPFLQTFPLGECLLLLASASLLSAAELPTLTTADEVRRLTPEEALRAMKRADPAIKVGGPAVANSYAFDFHRRFIESAKQQLDFYSYHLYVSGSVGESDAGIMAKGTAAAGPTREIVQRLRAASPARPIEAILDEFNISWTWKVRDPRMTGSKGAVFDALTAVSAITAGADAAAAWNDRDGTYGKTGGKNERRPGAEWLHLSNEFLVDEICATTTSAEKALVPFAIRTGRGQSLMLINRDSCAREVRLSLGEGVEAPWQRHEISVTGATKRDEAPGATATLPEHSLTLWTR
jgi:xylan 1,4-beta-xylosidase